MAPPRRDIRGVQKPQSIDGHRKADLCESADVDRTEVFSASRHSDETLIKHQFPGPRCFQRIAAGLNLSLDVACLTTDAAEIFEAVIMRLEFGVGDAPVLDR